MTFWDTAARYNNASVQFGATLSGRWLAANPDQRRNIVLATKLYGGMDGLTPNHCRLTRGNIKESVYASLERLQTETIDLLYFHHYYTYTPLEETYSALEDLVQADLVRYLAISNFSVVLMRMHLMMERIQRFGCGYWRCRINSTCCAKNRLKRPAAWLWPRRRAFHLWLTARWRKAF